jgi:hypothetical protein
LLSPLPQNEPSARSSGAPLAYFEFESYIEIYLRVGKFTAGREAYGFNRWSAVRQTYQFQDLSPIFVTVRHAPVAHTVTHENGSSLHRSFRGRDRNRGRNRNRQSTLSNKDCESRSRFRYRLLWFESIFVTGIICNSLLLSLHLAPNAYNIMHLEFP